MFQVIAHRLPLSEQVDQEFILERKNVNEAKKFKGASNGETDRELAMIRRAFSLGIRNGKITHRH